MTEAATVIREGKVKIGTLFLESGKKLPDVEIAYERVGPVHAPVVLVCHALTGHQYAVGTKSEPGWWSGLIGEDKWIDTNRWQVITTNVLGGCNGSTGPLSRNPQTGKRYRADFPFITIRDMVRAQYEALQALGISKIHTVIGASLGGMQVLEWGLMYPEVVGRIVPMAVTPYLSDYAISYNSIARQAIQNDPAWDGGNYALDRPPKTGISIARMVGMLTYRSRELFNARFGRSPRENWGESHTEQAFEVESYLQYQGKKLSRRFDANSYLYLLKAMDSHDIGRGRGGWKKALAELSLPIIAFGFRGDLLYPPEEVALLAGENGRFYEIDTPYGHDGFLVQFERWGPFVEECFR